MGIRWCELTFVYPVRALISLIIIQGKSLSWFGSLKLDSVDPPTGDVAIGTYQIDGQSPQPIYCPIVASRGHWFNLKFFETGSLPMGKHNISVIYTGGIYHLSWDFLTIQNGSLSDMRLDHQPLKSTNKTTILLSSVIPAVLIVICFLLGYFALQRHRLKKRLFEQSLEIDTSAIIFPSSDSQVPKSTLPSAVVPFIISPRPSTPKVYKARSPNQTERETEHNLNGSTSQRKRNVDEESVTLDATVFSTQRPPSYQP